MRRSRTSDSLHDQKKMMADRQRTDWLFDDDNDYFAIQINREEGEGRLYMKGMRPTTTIYRLDSLKTTLPTICFQPIAQNAARNRSNTKKPVK
jgi:hypothetical protein